MLGEKSIAVVKAVDLIVLYDTQNVPDSHKKYAQCLIAFNSYLLLSSVHMFQLCQLSFCTSTTGLFNDIEHNSFVVISPLDLCNE